MSGDGLCECGCGQAAPIATRNSTRDGWVKGQPRRFVPGHQYRAMRRPTLTLTCAGCGGPFTVPSRRADAKFCTVACAGAAHSGVANRLYNGGLCRRPDGRWVINCRDGSLLLYYRAVMAAQIGRLLRSDEIVHHRNEIVDDDEPDNLQILTRAEHMDLHRPALHGARGVAA